VVLVPGRDSDWMSVRSVVGKRQRQMLTTSLDTKPDTGGTTSSLSVLTTIGLQTMIDSGDVFLRSSWTRSSIV